MDSLVGIIMSSRSDWQEIKPATDILARLRVSFEASIMHTHRNSEKVYKYAETAEERELKMIIVSSNEAAVLCDELASKTNLPVICIPVSTGRNKIIDSYLSFANIPSDFSLDRCMTESSRAENAAFMAATILSEDRPAINSSLKKFISETNIELISPQTALG